MPQCLSLILNEYIVKFFSISFLKTCKLYDKGEIILNKKNSGNKVYVYNFKKRRTLNWMKITQQVHVNLSYFRYIISEF